MTAVKLTLTPGEAAVYSGACLTYSGVPFHRVEKARTTPEDLDRLDGLFDRFVRARGELQRGGSGGEKGAVATSRPRSVDVVLSAEDVELLIEVFEAVLREHDGFDYDLELHVAPRNSVESALGKLQSIRQPQ